jgi:raffinose/stachyose/melibiose transport system permease protein
MREPYVDKDFAGVNAGRMLELMASYGGELAVTQNCVDRGNLPAALDFLQWLTSPEVALKQARQNGSMPSSRDLDRELPPNVLMFKPEVGGRPLGPMYYDLLGINFDELLAVRSVAPLYMSGQMELEELQDFVSKFHGRFVDLVLRETRQNTRTGLFKGSRLYGRLIYDQEQMRRKEAAGGTEELERRREEDWRSAAGVVDSVADTEDVVRAIVDSPVAAGGGAAAYRHVPIITKARGQLLGNLCRGGAAVGLAALAVFLLRKRRLGRMLGYPEKSIYAFILPSIFFVLAFSYYPALSGIYHAFTNWDGGAIDEFTGLANLKEMFTDQVLAVAVVNLCWLLLAFLVQMIPPLAAALLIYHLASVRLRYWFRVALVLPLIVPGIVYWIVWKLLYQTAPSGVINTVLLSVETWLHGHGLDVQLAHNWLADPRTALGAIIFMGFPWVGTLGVLIYLAGLENIDPGLFEAAEMDGAGWLKRFWHIERPLLARQIKLNLVLGLIGVMQGYGTILFMTNGGPGFATTVPGFQMYGEAFNAGRLGYASAIGLAMFVVILAATAGTSKVVRAKD